MKIKHQPHKNQHKNFNSNHTTNKLEAKDTQQQDSKHEQVSRYSAYVRGNPLVSMVMAVAGGVLLSRMLAS